MRLARRQRQPHRADLLATAIVDDGRTHVERGCIDGAEVANRRAQRRIRTDYRAADEFQVGAVDGQVDVASDRQRQRQAVVLLVGLRHRAFGVEHELEPSQCRIVDVEREVEPLRRATGKRDFLFGHGAQHRALARLQAQHRRACSGLSDIAYRRVQVDACRQVVHDRRVERGGTSIRNEVGLQRRRGDDDRRRAPIVGFIALGRLVVRVQDEPDRMRARAIESAPVRAQRGGCAGAQHGNRERLSDWNARTRRVTVVPARLNFRRRNAARIRDLGAQAHGVAIHGQRRRVGDGRSECEVHALIAAQRHERRSRRMNAARPVAGKLLLAPEIRAQLVGVDLRQSEHVLRAQHAGGIRDGRGFIAVAAVVDAARHPRARARDRRRELDGVERVQRCDQFRGLSSQRTAAGRGGQAATPELAGHEIARGRERLRARRWAPGEHAHRTKRIGGRALPSAVESECSAAALSSDDRRSVRIGGRQCREPPRPVCGRKQRSRCEPRTRARNTLVFGVELLQRFDRHGRVANSRGRPILPVAVGELP